MSGRASSASAQEILADAMRQSSSMESLWPSRLIISDASRIKFQPQNCKKIAATFPSRKRAATNLFKRFNSRFCLERENGVLRVLLHFWIRAAQKRVDGWNHAFIAKDGEGAAGGADDVRRGIFEHRHNFRHGRRRFE